MARESEARQAGSERERSFAVDRDALRVDPTEMIGPQAPPGSSSLAGPAVDGVPTGPSLPGALARASDATRIHVLRQLQRTRGNVYVQRLVAGLSGAATVQREDTKPAADVLPDPVDVTWGGDRFKITFERTKDETDRLDLVIQYSGAQPVEGISVQGKTLRIGVAIASGPLNARFRRESGWSLDVDLVYPDVTRRVKLTDDVTISNRPDKKGREHRFGAGKDGQEEAGRTILVLDPNAVASSLNPPAPEEKPGENPSSKMLMSSLGAEIQIDGDGDQYKELLLRLTPKSYWPDPTYADAPKTLTLQMTQISSQETLQADFDIPKSPVRGSFFPIVKEVTDGKGPTRISLVVPTDTQWLDVNPPERTPTGAKYLVVAAGSPIAYPFQHLGPIHKVESADAPKFIGGMVSVDVALGAYGDRFRLTFQPTAADKGIFGIAALNRGNAKGGMGVELQLGGPIKFQVVDTGPVSLGIDLDGDGKADLQMFDQLTTPEEVDGGGPPDINRNHRIRVVGAAIGGEKKLDFTVRNNFLSGGYANPSDVDRAAASNAAAVGGLTQEATHGTFTDELVAYEKAFAAVRQKAADEKLIEKTTFDAWISLSGEMIRLQPQVNAKSVDQALQASAATHANDLYTSLAAETKGRWKSGFTMSDTSTLQFNPYTGEAEQQSTVSTRRWGAGLELSGDLKAGRWDDAFRKYQTLANGLDQWIVDRSAEVKGASSTEARDAKALASMRHELNEIAGYQPIRVNAVFHPDEKYRSESGFAPEVPLSLYCWKQGNTWYLRDLTNPQKRFDDQVDLVAGEVEPPHRLFLELDNKAHFIKGTIHYDIPEKQNGQLPLQHLGGQVATTERLTWKDFFTYASVALAAIGITLATFGTGTVAVVGAWALAGSALAGGTAAAIDLAQGAIHGTLDTATVVIDVAQILSAVAGGAALASGRIVTRAIAAAEAGAPLEGASASLAVFSQRLYVPLVGTRLAADAVSFLAMTDDAAKQLDQIQNAPGSQADKDRAKALLLAQLAVSGGMLVLSIKGEMPSLSGKPPLVLEDLGRTKVALVGEATTMVHTTTPGAPKTDFTRVTFKLAPAQQVEYVNANVEGLTSEQAEWLLQSVQKRGGSIIFGGSRVRGASTSASDLDVGFENLSKGQINGLMNDFNKKFGGSSKVKIIQHNWIYPGSKPASVPEIVSPEEFFLRSGVRGPGDGPKAGQAFGPSGYIKISPDGTVEAGRL